MDTFDMLQELLRQNQLELIPGEDIRAVYLMNDAVESFLVFENAEISGEYQSDFEGQTEAILSHDGQNYILKIQQGESASTLSFDRLSLDVHLYNYTKMGHFWVKGYEYLRQLEYRIAILRDKLDYLGEQYCTSMEKKLAHLADFPPLNYCCYPAASEKYIVPREEPWVPTEEAIAVMMELAKEVKDSSMQRILRFYRRHPYPIIARQIARMLHRNSHVAIVDLLTRRLEEAASVYPDRSFGKELDEKHLQFIRQMERRQQELERKGIESVLLREEPFTVAEDDLDFQVHLMIWKKGLVNKKVRVESYILM